MWLNMNTQFVYLPIIPPNFQNMEFSEVHYKAIRTNLLLFVNPFAIIVIN